MGMENDTPKTDTVPTPSKKQVPAKKAKEGPMYPVKELAANAGRLFGTRQECVMAALSEGGDTEYTVLEAKRIVEGFLKREVI